MTDVKINYKRTRLACYYASFAMSSVFCLPPMLFVTFRESFGISYTLLGTLVLVNFCTQLIIDTVFTFFSKHFNIKNTIRIMPLLTSCGLIIYALVPTFMPQYAYAGLVTGTVIFSVAAGLCEVLLSPTVAALPSDNAERDMSILHSIYGYGVVCVVIISTLFLKLFGQEHWMFLTLLWAVLPLISSFVLFISPMPDFSLAQNKSTSFLSKNQKYGVFLCVLCIFFGSAAENAMTNWISGFMENALKITKSVGDIVGFTVFALLLALGRTLYAKYGRNILNVLTVSMIFSALCYIVAGISPYPVLSVIACSLTGLFTSMLWPGTLILLENNYPGLGVTAYALMAAGGDFGASVAPQTLGIVVDKISCSDFAINLSSSLSLTTEQIAMKIGMILSSVFPVLGVVVLLIIKKHFRKA